MLRISARLRKVQGPHRAGDKSGEKSRFFERNRDLSGFVRDVGP